MGYGGIVRGREKEMQEREEAAKCPPCSQNAHDKREGMEPDDLPCSRNARPEKALVGRAQQKINQPPPLRENERAWTGKLDR